MGGWVTQGVGPQKKKVENAHSRNPPEGAVTQSLNESMFETSLTGGGGN